MKYRIVDEIILQQLIDSVAKPTKPDSPDHVPFSDSVDPDSDQLPNVDDPVMPDSIVVFEKSMTDQWTHTKLNLPQGGLLRK